MPNTKMKICMRWSDCADSEFGIARELYRDWLSPVTPNTPRTSEEFFDQFSKKHGITVQLKYYVGYAEIQFIGNKEQFLLTDLKFS